MKKERDIGIDFARALSMMFVIALHIYPKPGEQFYFFQVFLTTLLFTCNFSFFMISGRLNLQKKFNCKKDVLIFYYRKFVSIIFPMITTITIHYLCKCFMDRSVPSISELYLKIMNDFGTTHLWFVYSLAGLLLSVPLLSKALQNMSDGELDVAFYVCLIWNFASIILTKNFGITFPFSGWILSGWMLSFFAGHYCFRRVNDKNKKWFYIFGTIGLILNILGGKLMPNYYNQIDLTVTFVVFAIAFYLLITEEIKIRKQWLKKVISFLARHSYCIYLIHMDMLNVITPRITPFLVSENTPYYLKYIITYGVAFVLCIIVGTLLDELVLFPCQKLLNKAVGRSN